LALIETVTEVLAPPASVPELPERLTHAWVAEAVQFMLAEPVFVTV
jgi:hypothetical protein